MGISGLLPILKSISHRVHISKYRGEKVAIDAYSWLHKGAYSCSQELCENIYTDRYVQYCMQRIALLQENGVIPVVVFDGGRLPMKQEEESGRHRSRRENLEKARAFMASGNSQAAFECYQRAVDISPAVAKRFIDCDGVSGLLIQALRAEGVEYVVAPYEADAQMTYLAITGRVHAVITEDSDMLPYGCPRVLFKMDRDGDGEEICAADLAVNRGLSFVGFTPQMFLEMCILAGCDFLKAPQKIGMKKAHLHIRKYRSFTKACKGMRFASVMVPRGYEAAFQRAIWTFLHQRVFDAESGRLVHLTPLPPGGLLPAPGVTGALPEDDPGLSFLGPPLDDTLAARIAAGDVDPMTHEPFPLEEDRPSQPPCPQANGWKPDARLTSSMMSGVNHGPRAVPGAKAAPQKGMLAFFPKLGGQKARRDGLQHPKSAPAVQTGALWQHAHMNGQGGAQAPPQSLNLPHRYRPAVAGSQSSLSAGSQEQARGKDNSQAAPAHGAPSSVLPTPSDDPLPSHRLEEEASSPDGEAFEQLPTRDPPPGRFGVRQLGESAEGQSAGGTEPSWEGIGLGGIGRSCGSLQGGRGPGGGPEGPPAGGGKRRRTDAATLSWQAGSLDSIPGGAHCGDSVGDQLAASKQLLREEESFDGVSNGESNASVTEGGLPEVPRRRHGGGLGLLESSGLGDGIGGLEESLGEELGGFGGGHNSEKEISGGESAEGYPLGLRGSPTVEEELGGLRRVRRQGSSVSVGVWGGSRGPSLEHHFGGEDSVLGPEGWQCLGGGGVDEVSGGALSALDDSRFAMSFSAENRGTAPLRAPLSPLRQPVQRRPGEGQGTSHRKRKVSWFFGRQPCELGSDSDECPTMEEKSPGEGREGDTLLGAQCAGGSKENQGQGFHNLGHIPRYTALACVAVQNIASKCGMPKPNVPPPELEARGKVRHPFKAPRPASATPVEATAKVAGKKGLGGTLARFKFKKK